MLRSGNDAALMIADYVAGGVKNFASLMNNEAIKLGMKNSNFINPSGLEENGIGNISTAYDMAILMKNAMKNQLFRNIVSTKYYKLNTNMNSYYWVNKNKLLFNYEYTTGGKTGYTKKARRTLVTTSKKNDVELVVVTFNDANDFNTHKYLHNKYLEKLTNKVLIVKNKIVFENSEYKLINVNDCKVNVFINDNIKINLVNGQKNSYIDIIINGISLDRCELNYISKMEDYGLEFWKYIMWGSNL